MIRLLTGDCREVLKGLADESVHCVVTSPPYYGLRDYGTAKWEGGDAECDHRHQQGGEGATSAKQNTSPGTQSIQYRDTCPRCGARRIDNQIGLEPTPAEYIASLVAVFAEVKRVLHPTGVVFLNLGDSYATSQAGNTTWGDGVGSNKHYQDGKIALTKRSIPAGLKPKDLMMIPARVAIALQDDGWWLRSEIVWAKKAPMPESVTDRCTRSHEMVYMLTKRASYYADMVAVQEDAVRPGDIQTFGGRKARESEIPSTDPRYRNGSEQWGRTIESGANGTRNCRDVWTLGPEPFRGAHFATFPTELARRCIAMGTSERGACPKCGAPWERAIERETGTPVSFNGSTFTHGKTHAAQASRAAVGQGERTTSLRTTGWRPTCDCNAGDPIPCTVLDPFAGSGTVGLVCDRLGRDAILIDLNPEYSEMQRARVTADAPLFAQVAE